MEACDSCVVYSRHALPDSCLPNLPTAEVVLPPGTDRTHTSQQVVPARLTNN